MVNEKFVLSEMPLNRMRSEPAAGKRGRRRGRRGAGKTETDHTGHQHNQQDHASNETTAA